MNSHLAPTLISALENIYISPLELCNLNCRICYTNKTKSILSNEQIQNFVDNYNIALTNPQADFLHNFKPKFSKANTDSLKVFSGIKSILFCGGEVFTLPNFPSLVNTLQSQNIFISTITNGTIDRLNEISDPSNCQLLVSFDGPREVHDANRGLGMHDRSLQFIDHALTLGFPVEIMFLITPASYPYIDTFNIRDLKLNYITQKTSFYTDKHPLSNDQKAPGLTPQQIINIKKNYPSIPNKNFGCFQMSLQSNGYLYGCCETPYPLGNLSEDMGVIISKFISSLNTCASCGQCGGCTSPEFLCGYKKELRLLTCQEVAKTFNET